MADEAVIEPVTAEPSRPSDPAAGAEAPDLLDTRAAGGIVVRGGSLRVLSYLVAVLVSVVGAALMLRHLDVTEFGRYTTVLSLITVIAALSDLGLTAVGLRQAAVGDRAHREQVMRNVLGMRLTTSIIGVAAACAFGLAVGYPSEMVLGIVLAGGGLLLLVTLDSYTMRLQVGLRLGLTAGLELLRQTSATLVVVLLVIAGASFLPFTGSQIPGLALAALIAALVVSGSTGLMPSFDRAQWKQMARELLPFAAAVAIGAIYFRVEIVILSLFAPGHQTGLFSGAFRITEVVVAIPALVASSALPVVARFAEYDRARLPSVLHRMFHASLAAGVGIALAIFLGAPFALAVVAGPQYHSSIPVLRIQSVTVAFTFLVTQWGMTLLALKRTRALLVANALALAVAISATLALGGIGWARGASIALVVAEMLLAGSYTVALARQGVALRVRIGGVASVAVAAAMGVGVALLTGVSSLPATIIGVTIYLLVLALTGGLPPEIHDLVPARYAKRIQRAS
jgi:O-antigen/teichoic acid export membrane protein